MSASHALKGRGKWYGRRGLHTFLRSPFFQRYPLLITTSFRPPRSWPFHVACASPSSSSSESSSPLWDLRSAIADSGGCATAPARKLGPAVYGDGGTRSGERIESESDSVPDTVDVSGFGSWARQKMSGGCLNGDMGPAAGAPWKGGRRCASRVYG